MNAHAPALSLASDLLTGTEWNAAQIRELFRLAASIKAHPDRYKNALAGRFLAMVFEKPSLRTRVTFEVGIVSMGGSAILLDHANARLGERESIADVARSLSRWVHGIVARVFEQEALDTLAAYATVPVINALSDLYHPCQTLADFFTLEEKFGSARGVKLAYIGDGNNVCHSLMIAGARVGAHVRVAFPARKPFTRTSGPAWARKARPKRAPPFSRSIRSMMRSCPMPRRMLFSSTVFPRIAARKSPTK